jgi:HPt (histidine-containing phosphotransfer) domain-containing protein
VANTLAGDRDSGGCGNAIGKGSRQEIGSLGRCHWPIPPGVHHASLENSRTSASASADVVEVYYQDYPGHVRALREAVSDNNVPQLERTAHSLKGALGTVGATIAYTLASELETMGRAVHLEGAGTALHKLEDELARIVAFFAEPE